MDESAQLLGCSLSKVEIGDDLGLGQDLEVPSRRSRCCHESKMSGDGNASHQHAKGLDSPKHIQNTEQYRTSITSIHTKNMSIEFYRTSIMESGIYS